MPRTRIAASCRAPGGWCATIRRPAPAAYGGGRERLCPRRRRRRRGRRGQHVLRSDDRQADHLGADPRGGGRPADRRARRVRDRGAGQQYRFPLGADAASALPLGRASPPASSPRNIPTASTARPPSPELLARRSPRSPPSPRPREADRARRIDGQLGQRLRAAGRLDGADRRRRTMTVDGLDRRRSRVDGDDARHGAGIYARRPHGRGRRSTATSTLDRPHRRDAHRLPPDHARREPRRARAARACRALCRAHDREGPARSVAASCSARCPGCSSGSTSARATRSRPASRSRWSRR